MHLGDGGGDGQAEPRPALAVRPDLVHPVEPVEDERQVLLRDADAGIADGRDRLVVLPDDRAGDRAAGRRVAEGVVQDVQEQLPQPDPVAPDRDAVHRAEAEPQALFLGQGLEVLRELGEEAGDVDLLEVERLEAGVAPGQDEQLADDLGHVAHFLGHELERPPVFVLAPRLLQHERRFGLDDGQGRPQLVGGVGDEPPLL